MNSIDLKKTFIFSNLSSEELSEIEKIVKIKVYDKGEIIFFDTEPYNGFYIVIKGLVKIFKISKDGKEHILHLVGPNYSFADVPLFENSETILRNEAKYPANAMSIEDYTKVILIPAKPFLKIIEPNNKLLLKMLSGFAKRLRFLNHHIEEIALKDVSKRVAGFILTEYSKEGNSHQEKPAIELNISKNDLASYLGTIPETLSRTFKKMQEDELIEVDGKTIGIMDLKSLKELSA